ncbi:MAG: DUF2029 domain-containing protein [Prochlorococcus marinus CUG1431]|uniref:DUF2029 domain-containing protein n=1 Tax=Prochlorococcus marinus CUG1433 TaxID=2774506 RepID=A0A9D9BX02_PROMR|nr:DUF2029 domain-containing protein [Prochlorococcus marinus CUG1433]MBO6981055.1 DUF2029 domain-containing protein [Prochlorococcus marinus CUG1431]
MNSIKKKIEWDKYIVAFSPIFLIFYISNETYAIDYRAFYLAGKSVLNNLNPYLNHIALSNDFYGPINSELSKFSGWKYPPLASYIFTPLASLPYELSKNIFNLISLLSISFLTFFTIKKRIFDINPYSLIIVGISFPALSIISRGQIEILIVSVALISLHFYKKNKIFLSASLIAILGFIKVFPLLLSITFLKSNRKKKFFIYLIISLLILYFLNLILCPIEWRQSFIERITIPWNQMPLGDLKELPNNLGVIKDSMMVRTSDARNLFHSHFFVFGFANPLLSKNLFLSGIIGTIGALICLFKYSKYSTILCFFTIMNWINIVNPISWIMGLFWYVPLFIFSYDKIKSSLKIIIALPLILPPFLNISGYSAALISLFIMRFFSKESLNNFYLIKD